MKILVTNTAPYYASEELKDWCTQYDITHIFIAPYKYQSMGLVERYNWTLEDGLQKLKYAHGSSWVDHLPRSEESTNEVMHSTFGYSHEEL